MDRKNIERYLVNEFNYISINNENSFLYIRNREGKIWLLNIENQDNFIKSLDLIYSLTIFGKIKKTILKILIFTSLFKRIFKNRIVHLSLSTKILNEIEKLYGKDMNYSIFFGTPSPDQKATVKLIANNKNIYLKITENYFIYTKFKEENQLLESVKLPIQISIPTIKFTSEISDEIYIMIQEENSIGYSVKRSKTKKLIKWFDDLYKYNLQKKTFHTTDYFKFISNSLPFLKEKMDQITFEIYNKNYNYFKSKYTNRIINTSIAHRDFTVWNTKTKKNLLYIFDWEYAKEYWIQFLDVIHYIIQPSVVKNNKSSMIISKLDKLLSLLNSDDFSSVELVVLYLLDVVALYVTRGDYDNKMINQWISIMNYYDITKR